MKKLNLMFVMVLIGLSLISCQSKSGHLADKKPEKVVIIDSKTRSEYDNGFQYFVTDYKVKRIEHGVSTWIELRGKPKYEANDTIFHNFIN